MPNYKQHEDKEILIPQFMLVNSVVAYKYNHLILSFLTMCIYFSSIIFWSKVRHTGIEKTIDIVFVFTGGVYGTHVSYSLNSFYNMFWIYTVCLCILVFIINETLFYYQVRIHYNKRLFKHEKRVINYRFFSLEYTDPHTHEREMAYYRSTIIHGVFFHVVVSLSSIYCIVHGKMDTEQSVEFL